MSESETRTQRRVREGRNSNMNDVMTVFEAGYGRDGLIDIEPRACDRCHASTLCLSIDSSEGEYGAGFICKPCIDEMFLKYREEPPKG